MRFKGEIITRLAELIERFLFPPKCSFCQEILPINEKRPYICKSCKNKIKKQKLIFCPECGNPQDIFVKLPFCPYCSDNKYKFEYLIAPFDYSPIIREGIHHLKFDKCPTVAETFGMFIYERMIQTDIKDKIKLLIPAPISTKRIQDRGYNQSELICRYISKVSGIPYRNALKKIKDTPPQSSLSEEKRKSNIKGAIAPALPIPEDNILFIDDVYTTGSTCDECCRVLKSMGVRKIYVAVSATNQRSEKDDEKTDKKIFKKIWNRILRIHRS